MTVIAAVVRDGKVTMGADSASIMDGRVNHDGSKIFSVPLGSERAVFGFAGPAQLGDLVRYRITIADPPPRGSDVRWWLTEIAIDICQIAVDAKPAILDEDGWVSGAAVVGFRGDLWMLAQQSVMHVRDGFYAIGSGGDVALGVLAALDGSDMSDEQIVTEAVEIAARFCDTVALGPDGVQLVSV